MTDFTRSYEIVVDAPVHTVFEYCRDPRRIFADNPKVEVTDVTLTPEGIGTTAHIVAKHGVVTEVVTQEYIEFVQDERIVLRAHPKVTIVGMTKEITHTPTWTWTFLSVDGGTQLTLVFLEAEAIWWQRLFDVVTEKSWSKEIRDWMTGVKTGAEEEATSTVGESTESTEGPQATRRS